MPLRPVTIDDTLLGQPLPWDLYTVSGVLVASAGTVVATPALLTKLTERPLFRQAGDDGDDFPQRIATLIRHYPTILKVAGTPRLEPLIRLMAKEIMELAQLDHDAMLGLLRLLPEADPAARHCLLVALLAQDMARLQLPKDSPLIEPTVCAALTMNIGSMRLHSELSRQKGQPDALQRESLALHPEDSVILLRAGELRDSDWLGAVEQHHENLDGSGYPRRLSGDAIGIPARILRLADFFVAKIRSRRYRPAETSQTAFRHIFGNEQQRLDGRIAQLLMRKLGLHPPGTLLRLASHEMSVVTRKLGSAESAGKALAFIGPGGRLLKHPVERNTSQAEYAVLNISDPDPAWPKVDWPSLWGY